MNNRDLQMNSQGQQPHPGQMGSGRKQWNTSSHRRRQSGSMNPRAGELSRALGWFSIGLGLAEVAAPKGLAKLIGVKGNRSLLRAFGVREIASGIGILAQPNSSKAVWSRVAGDAVDLACLGAAFNSSKAKRNRLTAATIAVAGVTALDVICAEQLRRNASGTSADGTIHTTESIAINRPPEEVYRFWRDLQNLPKFMYHLESVRTTEGNRSHWVAKAPAGRTVEWDAEITTDQPNRMIAWRSLEGADVDNAGSVRFEPAPGRRGTIVTVEMRYQPPAGALGATIAKLFGKEPSQQMHEDLRRFKQVLETGEVITTEGQPSGRSSSTSWRYDLTSHKQDAMPPTTQGHSRAATR